MQTTIKCYLKKSGLVRAVHFVLTNLFQISYIKTLYINFKCLPFRQALHIPIVVGRKVELRDTSGIIEIKGKVRTGMLLLSFYYSPIDSHKNPLIFFNRGKIIIGGKVYLRSGVCVWVEKNGVLTFNGENAIGANTLIACFKKMDFGFLSVCSWNCQIYDTNFHFIEEIDTGFVGKRSSFVIIGSKVWIGNSVHITKGSKIPDGSIVSNRSVVNKSFIKVGTNLLISGHPAEVVGNNVQKLMADTFFDFSRETEYINKYELNSKQNGTERFFKIICRCN